MFVHCVASPRVQCVLGLMYEREIAYIALVLQLHIHVIKVMPNTVESLRGNTGSIAVGLGAGGGAGEAAAQGAGRIQSLVKLNLTCRK